MYDIRSKYEVPSMYDVQTIISDAHGKTMRSFKQPLAKGVNEIQVRDLGSLSAGTYVLQVITNDEMKSKRI